MPNQYFVDWHAKNPGKAKQYRDKVKLRNPDMMKKARAKWAAANPDERRTQRNSWKRGGLSHAALCAVWESQGHTCAICHTPLRFPDRGTHIDHCHETGKFRGILCRRCNQQLGHFEAWPEFSLAALDYLEQAYVV